MPSRVNLENNVQSLFPAYPVYLHGNLVGSLKASYIWLCTRQNICKAVLGGSHIICELVTAAMVYVSVKVRIRKDSLYHQVHEQQKKSFIFCIGEAWTKPRHNPNKFPLSVTSRFFLTFDSTPSHLADLKSGFMGLLDSSCRRRLSRCTCRIRRTFSRIWSAGRGAGGTRAMPSRASIPS